MARGSADLRPTCFFGGGQCREVVCVLTRAAAAGETRRERGAERLGRHKKRLTGRPRDSELSEEARTSGTIARVLM